MKLYPTYLSTDQELKGVGLVKKKKQYHLYPIWEITCLKHGNSATVQGSGSFQWLVKTRRCASRDSTNQNASFIESFSRLERAVFRGICGDIFALFQVYVGNFDTILPSKVVGTLYLDSNCVSFKYFAFASVCDKFELLGHVQAAMMIWVLFSPFFLDSLLVTVSGFIGLFRSTCYFNLSSL